VVIDETAPEATAECRGFLRRWQALGGLIAVEAELNLVTADGLAADATLLDDLDAPAIVLCAFWRVGEPILEGIRGDGITAPIIAGPSLDSGQWIPDDVDADLGDFSMLTFASTWGDDPAPSVVDAVADFLVADGVPPTSGRFVLGADLAELYRFAVTEADSIEAQAVADAIRSMSSVDPGSGPVSFDGRNAPTGRTLRVMRHDDGALVFDGLIGG
jgi:ABC-type branched-subunit amino acid transport system substrate-binding protein